MNPLRKPTSLMIIVPGSIASTHQVVQGSVLSKILSERESPQKEVINLSIPQAIQSPSMNSAGARVSVELSRWVQIIGKP